ncbi:MAG: B-box zinc finger protein [Promethearchaeota archaeon]
MSNQICISCGNKAKYNCLNCNRPICGRCRSKQKKIKDESLLSLIGSTADSLYYRPAGLCKDCRPIVLMKRGIDTYFKLIDIIRIN